MGKRIWPDQLEGKRCKLFVAPEHFSDTALRQPPYATVPWYDAKVRITLSHDSADSARLIDRPTILAVAVRGGAWRNRRLYMERGQSDGPPSLVD